MNSFPSDFRVMLLIALSEFRLLCYKMVFDMQRRMECRTLLYRNASEHNDWSIFTMNDVVCQNTFFPSTKEHRKWIDWHLRLQVVFISYIRLEFYINKYKITLPSNNNYKCKSYLEWRNKMKLTWNMLWRKIYNNVKFFHSILYLIFI